MAFTTSSADFSLTAVVVPQLDAKAALKEANRLGALFSAALAKAIKPVNVTVNPQSVQKANAELGKLQKNVAALNKPLNTFQKNTNKTFGAGSKAANDYGKAVTKAGKDIRTKLTTDTSSTFGKVGKVASDAASGISDAFRGSTAALQRLFSGLAGRFGASFASFAPAIAPALQSLKGIGLAIAANVLPQLRGLASSALGVFRNVASTVADTFRSGFANVKRYTDGVRAALGKIPSDAIGLEGTDFSVYKTAAALARKELQGGVGNAARNAYGALRGLTDKGGASLINFGSKITAAGAQGGASMRLLTAGLGAATRALGSFVAATGPVGVAIAAIVAAIATAAAAIAGFAAASFLGGKALISFAQRASDANEAANASAVVFNGSNAALTYLNDTIDKYGAKSKEAAAASEFFGKTTAGAFARAAAANDNFGLTTAQLNKAIVPQAALLRNAGFEGEKLATITAKNAQVAQDLASVYNISVEEALQKINAGLRGEGDALESVGISLNEQAVSAEAAALGYQKLGGEYSTTAKIAARQSLIIKQGAIAAGDAADTADSLANTQRKLGTVIEETKDKISESFRPAAEAVSKVFLAFAQDVGPKVVAFFNRLKPTIDKVGQVIVSAINNFRGLIAIFQALKGPAEFILKSVFLPMIPGFKLVGFVVKDTAKRFGDGIKTILDLMISFAVGYNGLVEGFNKNRFNPIDLPTISQTSINSLENALAGLESKALFQGIDIGDALKAGIEQSLASTLSVNSFGDAFKGLADAFNNELAGANALVDAQNNLNNARKSAADARAAEDKAREDANRRIADIDEQLNDLRRQRADLQSDIAGQARAEAESLEKIRSIEADIRDLIQDREQALFDEQRRREEFQPRLEEFEDQQLVANIRLARAKRDVEAAQKAINDAVEAGLPKEQFNLNLAGLSLDQVRVKLAQTRATLAAQKQAAQAQADETSGQKSATELQEDLTLAKIAENDAARAIRDLEIERGDFIRENGIAQREFNEQQEEFLAREKELNRNKTTALAEHGRLLRGEIGPLAEIRDLSREIANLEGERKTAAEGVKAAQEASAAAANAVKIAEGEVLVALAKSKEKVDEIFTAEKNLLELKRLQSGAQGALNEQLQAYINKLGIAQTDAKKLEQIQADVAVRDIFGNINPVTGRFQDPANIDQKLNAITEGLRQILRNLGVTALAQGAVVNSPTQALIGEAGPEVVLPLSRPGRLAELLSSKQVLPPVLQALSGIVSNTPRTRSVKLELPQPEPLQIQQITDPALLNVMERVFSALTSFTASFNNLFRILASDLTSRQRILGFKEGGVIQGTGSPWGQIIRVAEGRGAEAVLPLTRPDRMAAVLSNPQVLTPVLDALTPPSASGSTLQATRVRAQTSSLQEQKKRDQALAQAIAEAVGEVLSDSVGNVTTLNAEFHATSTNPQVNSREIKRQVEKLLKGSL